VCPPRRWPYFLVLTASLVGWNFNRVVAYPLEKQFFADYPFAVTSELLHWHRYQDFAEYFAAHERELADAGVDMAVFGLVIEHVDRHNWLADQRLANPPTLLFYFRDGFEWSTRVIPLLRTGFYRRFYKVPGTRIELAAHEPLETLVPGPSPFAPASNPSF
jgi:hypothetical protein